MKVYLTKYNTLCTTNTKVLSDLKYPQRVHWIPELYSRVKTGFSYVPHEAAYRVITKELIEYVKSNPVNGKTGFILAAGSQGWAGGKAVGEDKPSELDYSFKLGILSVTNIFAGRVAAMFEAYDYVATDASTCATGIKCMMDVQNLINNLGFDRVIMLAQEDPTSKLTLEFFGQSNANILIKDEEAGAIPSAFDSINSGFIVGQGSSVAVFESEAAVNKNAVTPKAELISAWVSAEEISNPIGQRPDGQGYQRAIKGALEMAKVQPSDIKIVKTHGTGTTTNNQSEKTALTTVLGNNFVATSYKQRIGHTVAASGLLETCLILDDIQKGIVPAIANRTENDDLFLSHDVVAPDGLLMSMAAGMGNIYAAAVFNPKV
jgi:3-oxoacyl-(acyl-carrier-protein) synthase